MGVTYEEIDAFLDDKEVSKKQKKKFIFGTIVVTIKELVL
jgi:hypothetical protein